MKNTNLADLVNEIEPIKAENKELRALVMSQQKMMNGINILLYSILHSGGAGIGGRVGGDASSNDGENSGDLPNEDNNFILSDTLPNDAIHIDTLVIHDAAVPDIPEPAEVAAAAVFEVAAVSDTPDSEAVAAATVFEVAAVSDTPDSEAVAAAADSNSAEISCEATS